MSLIVLIKLIAILGIHITFVVVAHNPGSTNGSRGRIVPNEYGKCDQLSVLLRFYM